MPPLPVRGKIRWCCLRHLKPPACRTFICCAVRCRKSANCVKSFSTIASIPRGINVTDGENPNTFNPAFSNGSIMDIGFYCPASAVALFGEPKSVQATASLLASGVDAHGVVVMDYGDFSVTLQHSKVSDSVPASEIQGEAGSLVIENCLNARKFALFRVAARCRISPNRSILIPCSTKQSCSLPVDEHLVDHPYWRSVASPPNC